MSKKDNIFTDEEIKALKQLARREIEKKNNTKRKVKYIKK